jgi:predicted RNase H-like HicB family nuclease
MQSFKFTAEITRDKEINQYIGIVPGLPGGHTQASTLDELYANLQEVVQLCLEEMTTDEINQLPEFIGFQQISVAV